MGNHSWDQMGAEVKDARLAAEAVAMASASMAYLLSHIFPWMLQEYKAVKHCQQSSGKGNLQVPSREFHPSAGP